MREKNSICINIGSIERVNKVFIKDPLGNVVDSLSLSLTEADAIESIKTKIVKKLKEDISIEGDSYESSEV